MKNLAPLKTPAATRHRIARMRRALDLLESGLDGNAISLGKADGESVATLLGGFGIELLSKSAIHKAGHVLKRGARPVLRRYYGAPIKKYVALYVFNVQTQPTQKEKS